MDKITLLIAGDKNFSNFVSIGLSYIKKLSYPVLIYDLGNLGYGKKFQTNLTVSSKIPLKPHIIRDALNDIDDDDFLVWIDADAIIYDEINEIVDNYDLGVTVRLPKQIENSNPINAGVIIVKKNFKTIEFVENWMLESEIAGDDQGALNKLCKVTTNDRNKIVDRNNVKIKVFPCEIYNNFYFAKKPDRYPAKIKHFKSKLRNLYPL
jgi:hypothetical protein